MDFSKETAQGLLTNYCEVLKELRLRNLIRSTNNPVADIAGTIVKLALKLDLVSGSTAGHDAIDTSGIRYEVKGRRITAANKSRQLSFSPGLGEEHFDFWVGCLVDHASRR